ncbi:MAG TPA: carboxypeptidase-like regulatory domain-containing protein [Phycisphaerae bacterium]
MGLTATTGQGNVGAPARVCPAPSVADLTVTVTRKNDGKPVEGAQVKISGPESRKGVTDASGNVVFRGIKPSPPQYTVTASKTDHSTEKTTVAVVCGTMNKAALQLKAVVKPVIDPLKFVVAVKKPNNNATRKKVTLKTDLAFDGDGTFTRSSAKIRFFTAVTAGTEIKFDGTDNKFAGAKLDPKGTGVVLFAEGATASDKTGDVVLKLTLKGGTVPFKPPAEAKATSVEVILDICKRRKSAKANPEPLPQPPAVVPAKPDDKLNAGRFIHKDIAGKHHERAMLIVRKAKPADFDGELVVDTENNKVKLFAAETGGAALVGAQKFANKTVPKDGKQLFVGGDATSGGLRDTGIKLGITGEADDLDHVKLTVVELEITAKVPTTQSARGTSATAPPNTHHQFKSNDGSRDMTQNAPTVLVRNCRDIELELTTVKPAALTDFAWEPELNPGSTKPLPVMTPSGKKAKLATDASGGYAVRGSVGDAAVFWNLVLVEIKIKRSQIRRNQRNFNDRSAAGLLVVGSGPAAFNVNAPATCGMYSRANIELTAGGEASLDKFCDRVHAGIVNVLQNTTAQANYASGGRERERVPTVSGLPNPVVNPATAVVDLGSPVLDRGGPAGTRATGGATIFLSQTRSTPANTTKRLVETCDNPAVVFSAVRPVFVPPPAPPPAPPPPPPPPPDLCTSNSGVNAFTIFLVAYSDDANFTYVAFGSGVWTVDYSGNVATPAPPPNPTPVWTKTTAGITGAGNKFTEIKNGQEAQAAGCEVRPPVYLTYIRDAR